MDLLQMSLSGALMIVLVILIRTALLNRLPRNTFSVLWGIILVRLLIPFSLPFRFSIWSFLRQNPAVTAAVGQRDIRPSPAAVPLEAAGQAAESAASTGEALQFSPWMTVWLIGMIACGIFFIVSYARCRREFRTSLPVDNEFAERWLENHSLKRRISIRQSDTISSPLTYGIFRPVILMPGTTDWNSHETLEYILAHEYSHICHFDAVTKLFITAALCVHWFNPLLWVMYVLANRDLELLCDSAVIRHFGKDSRTSYALTLIYMEETKAGLMPMCNSFSKNSAEERITAIMKTKKTTIPAILFAIVLTVGITAAFMTSASASGKQEAHFTETADNSGEPDISEQELFAEYALYGITSQGDTLYYHDEKIRYFLDGYETDSEQGGYNTFSRYAYYNASGTIDVHTVREDRQRADGATELFGPVTDIVPYSQEEFDARQFEPAQTAAESSTEATSAASEGDGDGIPLEDRFLPFRKYGIEYRKPSEGGLGNLYYLETPVLLFTDIKNDGGTFTYTSPDGGELLVSAVYNRDGVLTGIDVQDDVQDVQTAEEDALLNRQIQAQIASQWDQTLAPYVPFGLTYTYDDAAGSDGCGLKMYYNGQEVRGIADPYTGSWITEHSGGTTYSEDALELYAVYKNGKLAGLRPADPLEQQEWDALRNK